MKSLWITGLLLPLIGCTALQAVTAPPRDITGRLLIHAKDDSYVWRWTYDGGIGKECSGSGTTDSKKGESPYRDVDAGTQVVIKDSSGKLLGTGVVGAGAIADLSFHGSCEFSLNARSVAGSDFYTFEVGNRKGVTYSRKELEQNNWKVDLVMQEDSIQTNTKPSIDPKEKQDWTTVRELTRSSEEAKHKQAVAEEKAKRRYQEQQLCIAEQELAEFDGRSVEGKCKQVLSGLTPN